MNVRIAAPTGIERAAMWLFLASIVLIPVTKTANLPVLQTRLTAFDFAAGLAIICWLWASHRQLTLRLPAAAHWPLGLFLGAAVLSGWNAWRLLDGDTAFLQYVVEVLTFFYLAVYMLAGFNLISDEHRLRIALRAWVLGLGVTTVFGLIGTAELLGCQNPLSSLVLWNARVISTFRNPNQAAAYILPSAVLVASLWASRPDVTRLGHLLLLLYVAAAAVLVGTASRGGVIAGMVALVALTVVWRFRWRAVVLVALAALITIVICNVALWLAARGNACTLYLSQTLPSVTIALPELREQVAKNPPKTADESGLPLPSGGDTGTAVGLRRAMLSYAWALAREHPITGVGAGTMPYHVLQRSQGAAFVATHNTPLTLLAELGWPGMLAFAWLFGAIFWVIWREGFIVSGPLRGACLGLGLALFSLGVMALSFDAQRQRALWLGASLGLAAAQLASAARERDGELHA